MGCQPCNNIIYRQDLSYNEKALQTEACGPTIITEQNAADITATVIQPFKEDTPNSDLQCYRLVACYSGFGATDDMQCTHFTQLPTLMTCAVGDACMSKCELRPEMPMLLMQCDARNAM